MGERDAFGREIGEDSLSELGWSTARQPDPPVAHTPAPEAITPAPQPQQFSAPPMPRYQGRRRRGGSIVALIFLMSIAVAGAGAFFTFSQAGDAIDGLEGAIREAIPTVVAPTPAGGGEEAGGSLLRTRDFKAALAKLPSGDIMLLRVAPDRIDAQIADGGQMKIVQVRADGGVTTVTAPVGNPGRPVKVDPAAPARIVRTAARRAGRDPSDVSYLVLTRFGPRAEWQLFFGDGLHFSASASGKKVRRIG
jgi:hypothetical protein